MKTCSKCVEAKPSSEFSKHTGTIEKPPHTLAPLHDLRAAYETIESSLQFLFIPGQQLFIQLLRAHTESRGEDGLSVVEVAA